MKKIIILSKNEINAVNGGTAAPGMRNKNTNTSHLDYKSAIIKSAIIKSAVNTLAIIAVIVIIVGIKSGIGYCKRDRLRGLESVTEEPLTTKKFDLMMYSKLRN